MNHFACKLLIENQYNVFGNQYSIPIALITWSSAQVCVVIKMTVIKTRTNKTDAVKVNLIVPPCI